MRTLTVNARVDREDTPLLSVQEAKLAVRAARRLAACEDPASAAGEDVTPVESMPGYFRWKPSAAMRHTCELDIRVVFRFDDQVLELYSVRNRDDVYATAHHARMAEIYRRSR